MSEFVIIKIEPVDDDYNTIPQFQIHNRSDADERGIREGANIVATIFRNGDEWELLLGNKEPTYHEPDAVFPVLAGDELSDVKQFAQQFLDPSAVFFQHQLVLEVI
ncbi:MAG: hypothetical protein Q8922_09035 [Bacteroidota bacterium]|nr:hypothetical protein [Bacteroidota bacterium]MDP4234292.1 hypothetical protein [Bacteroidota bacterium]MDP4243227.1 hypothetical protein [Bacteroidota bacterium]MDP4288067.1 hypothetical protein [Bacteroidota bacterium]